MIFGFLFFAEMGQSIGHSTENMLTDILLIFSLLFIIVIICPWLLFSAYSLVPQLLLEVVMFLLELGIYK